MKRKRFYVWQIVVMLLAAATGQLMAAGPDPGDGALRRSDAAAKAHSFRPGASRQAGRESEKTWPAIAAGRAPQGTAACRQIVINPQMDIVELGPDNGTAEPWLFLDPAIYYVKEGESNLAYEGYSLVLPDGDAGDPTPRSDVLGQVVRFGAGLTAATIAYQRAMLDANEADKVYGELWKLTSDGEVDLSDPATYRLSRWTVTDSEGTWSREEIAVDAGLLGRLSGQEIALVLRTATNGGGAVEAEKEWVLFDDVTITACGSSGSLFLPVVRSD